jgi:hypothetical protein
MRKIAQKVDHGAEIYIDALMLLFFGTLMTLMTLGLFALIVFGIYWAGAAWLW